MSQRRGKNESLKRFRSVSMTSLPSPITPNRLFYHKRAYAAKGRFEEKVNFVLVSERAGVHVGRSSRRQNRVAEGVRVGQDGALPRWLQHGAEPRHPGRVPAGERSSISFCVALHARISLTRHLMGPRIPEPNVLCFGGV